MYGPDSGKTVMRPCAFTTSHGLYRYGEPRYPALADRQGGIDVPWAGSLRCTNAKKGRKHLTYENHNIEGLEHSTVGNHSIEGPETFGI